MVLTACLLRLLLVVSLVGEVVVNARRSSYDTKEVKKYLKKTQKKGFPPYKHKQTVDFVNKLEYHSNLKEGDNALDFGLQPIDLNMLQDEEFAQDVVEGVEKELTAIDQEFGEPENVAKENLKTTTDVGPLSLMHQGMYVPAPDYNALIDGLVNNVKRDMRKREMDPLYFGIHNKGIVRHSTKNKNIFHTRVPQTERNPEAANGTSSSPLGVGIIRGLSDLKRFGNAESRTDGNVTLVRTHYFYGPLNIDLIFGSVKGVHVINTTVSSLAAHALIQMENHNNATTLREFITDSPMEYEIRLRGAKNRRFRSLSQTSITRLLKRGSRMETRLERSFKRGLRKPIRDVTQRNKNRRNNGESDKSKKTTKL